MQHRTTAPPRAFHRFIALGATALAALGLSLGAASPALAHDELVGTAAEVSDDASTIELILSFNNSVMDVGSELIATAPDGTDLIAGAPTISGRDVIQELNMPGFDQTMNVAWRVVSSDGHPISGAFTLTAVELESGEASVEFGEAESAADEHDHADDHADGHDHDSDETDHEGEMTTEQDENSGIPVAIWIAIAVAVAVALGVGPFAMNKRKRAAAAKAAADSTNDSSDSSEGKN